MRVRRKFQIWVQLTIIFFLIQTLVRLILITENTPGLLGIVDAVFDGFLWDAGTWLVMSAPLLLVSIFLSDRWHQAISSSKILVSMVFVFTTILSFIGFCELTFWWEFHSRFNFIAVDYLVYTNEVLNSLFESFPMVWIMTGAAVFAAMVTFGVRKIKFTDVETQPFFKKSVAAILLGVVLPCVFLFGLAPWLEVHDEDFHEDQLARNGYMEFARAFRSNKIDYKAFYPVIPDEKAQRLVESKRSQGKLVDVFNLGPKRPNVVMIVVESLGAKFIGPLGNKEGTTPYLNALTKDAIFFDNFYASGTRTVRGLEALTLSIPPTPGYAVVKRPHSKGLYSLGHTLKENNYEPIFLYGGRGFFDNMNDFFSGNGFGIIDQENFEDNEVSFSNAWGVCDEDLFRKAEQRIAQQDQTNPFFMFLLTTSNHRPFTYPNGKIDIPSGESRAGAVKYTDYAIGTFLERAQKQKWAENTIFVVVADHSTEGRGQFDLEMEDYHIPLWIYAPHLLKPQRISKLGSQIDLVPSLIHILGLKDDSPFFGRSFFDESWQEERAFIGNYQFVGFYKDGLLTTLGPNRVVRQYGFDPVSKKQWDAVEGKASADEAISYYQHASHLLDRNLYRHPSIPVRH